MEDEAQMYAGYGSASANQANSAGHGRGANSITGTRDATFFDKVRELIMQATKATHDTNDNLSVITNRLFGPEGPVNPAPGSLAQKEAGSVADEVLTMLQALVQASSSGANRARSLNHRL